MANSEEKNIRSIPARLEGKPHGDRLVRFDVFYYQVDEQYAKDLLAEEPYRQSRVEDLKGRHMPRTFMKEAIENIASGGLSMISPEMIKVGTWLVMDMEVPQMIQRVRLLGNAVQGKNGDGIARDDTAAVFRCGMHIEAINREDLRRAENYLITKTMNQSR